jgi:hypothetical protein
MLFLLENKGLISTIATSPEPESVCRPGRLDLISSRKQRATALFCLNIF